MRNASGLRSHDAVDVISRRGRARGVELRLTEITAPGQVFMPFHFFETNVNEVTQSAFDPISREPNYKQCAVRVERSGAQHMKRLVVVGNGMAGVACVEHILKRNPDFEITIFGDETHVNYNRILLSMVLAGEKSADEIVLNDIEWYRSNNIHTRLGVRISQIDRQGAHCDRRRRPGDRLRQADSGHGQQRVYSADSGRRQRKRARLPHARRHPGAAGKSAARV